MLHASHVVMAILWFHVANRKTHNFYGHFNFGNLMGVM